MPAEEDEAGPLLSRLALVEQHLLDNPGRGLDAAQAQFLIAALRAQLARTTQLRAERDAACRALLQDWPELPELGPAEIEELLEQLGLVAEAEATEDGERRLRLTARGLAVLGLPEEDAPEPAPAAPDLFGICRALGLGTALRSPAALRQLAEALLAAAAEPAFWPDEEAKDEEPEAPSA